MIYRFENCVLDTERRELCRAGEVIPIEPKVFEVLVYLIVHRERVVTRKEILAQCWPEVHVGDQALTQCLRRVRHVIGQTRTTPQLIRTVHGSGYRCIAEVTELSEEPDSPLQAVTRPADPETSAGATPLSDALTPEVPRRPTAERRHLTILSCALVDIVTLVSRLDPENLPEVLQSFRTACFEVTAQFEGHVAQQSDDGFMVYFGYPQAHESAAHRDPPPSDRCDTRPSRTRTCRAGGNSYGTGDC
jgi:DNA-binding winged helix-turn-helix (wHTH) protein